METAIQKMIENYKAEERCWRNDLAQLDRERAYITNAINDTKRRLAKAELERIKLEAQLKTPIKSKKAKGGAPKKKDPTQLIKGLSKSERAALLKTLLAG